MQWGGPEFAKLFAEVRKDGRIHPAELRRPTLRVDCHRYYEAFCALGASRVWSELGPRAIQISEIEAYLNICGVEQPYTRLKYMRLIQRMDRVELKHIQEKRSKTT